MLCNVEITNKFASLTTMIIGCIWVSSRFIAENIKSLYIALEEMCDSINKAWVLGDRWFKQQIENKIGRRSSFNAREGDKKSERYRARKENH